ncbi:AGAP000930-PA-like protein [Anopheles sinensis]|uniref:Coronin n=1 Tax=Anopheles sinensis TaxID=74873 RepID=A0A084VUZ8_ANOSI|nr:AGAP000930-PA-like protein [Anopheles sinensis]
MAWRFKASKYKNAAPSAATLDMCFRDLIVGSYQTYGNNIAASAAFIAFNWEHVGSSVAVLPLTYNGRKGKALPLLQAHYDTVSYLDFSPFHDGLLATGSHDCSVKVWHIPEKGLEQSTSTPECTFSTKKRKVETVSFHPTADCLLTGTASDSVLLWDLIKEQEAFFNDEHPDVIQSLSWKKDGRLCATSCKDKFVRVLDPRIASPITLDAESHQNHIDSRIVWLGDQNRVLTTGFDESRLRQVMIRDLRNYRTPEKVLSLDSSTSVLMPLYDPDTNMLFLAGKGDTGITYHEVTEKEPHLIEGIRHSGDQTTRGVCLAPKRALKVMEGEVNRIMQLTLNAVIPVTYKVPRKSYRDYHADLYPDTTGCKTDLTATEWLNGANTTVKKISLDPAKRELGDAPIIPRLGPKPFSQFSTAASLEKVFHVPVAPGSQPARKDGAENGNHSLEQTGSEEHDSKESAPGAPGSQTSADCGEPMEQGQTDGSENVQLREKAASNGSPQRVSTAERVMMFETWPSSESVDKFDGSTADGDGQFQRMGTGRSTLADRRRMFEGRSQSVQDEKASPTPLRRRQATTIDRDDQKASDDSSLMAPPSMEPGFLRNRSDLSKENMPHATVKRSNSTSGSQPPSSGTTNSSTMGSKRTSTVFGRVSKFRHLQGVPGHKSTHIEDIRNMSRQVPCECDGFQANPERVAVPIAGNGGKIAVFELTSKGRLPDGVIPTLIGVQKVMDFQWDPFDPTRLAVAYDDGKVNLWQVPAGGLTESITEPTATLAAHDDKISIIRFHPLASNVLLTASCDMTMKIWDLLTMTERYCLVGNTDQTLAFAWSPCGRLGATVSKDGSIRIYEPRCSEKPVSEGTLPAASRGARIVWALEGEYLVLSCFDKMSERQLYVYKQTDLNTPMHMIGLDVSPSILMLYYDEDSSTLFATGKGDSTIYCFEITDEAPFICPLSHHRCTTMTQGLSFLAKNQCDVASVEFAKAYRLTKSSVEPLGFSAPRVKSELFQDDLFPDTKVLWLPTMTATEWFAGKNVQPARISLQPAGMEKLSSVQPSTTTATPKKVEPLVHNAHKPFVAPEHVQKQIQNSVSARMPMNTKLEQDGMEGVDEKEWEE